MASPAPDLTRAVAALGGDIDGALEELRVPAVVVDRDAVVRWLNARARELFGDVLGHPLLELVAPESSHAVRLQFSKKLLGTARATDYEVTLRSAYGSEVPVQVSTVAIEGSDHRVVGVFGITRVKTEPKPPPAHLPRRGLTPRQQEVLHLLADGCSTAQIANLLGIEQVTVRNHVRGVLRMLGVHSRLQAVAEARRRGLLAG